MRTREGTVGKQVATGDIGRKRIAKEADAYIQERFCPKLVPAIECWNGKFSLKTRRRRCLKHRLSSTLAPGAGEEMQEWV